MQLNQFDQDVKEKLDIPNNYLQNYLSTMYNLSNYNKRHRSKYDRFILFMNFVCMYGAIKGTITIINGYLYLGVPTVIIIIKVPISTKSKCNNEYSEIFFSLKILIVQRNNIVIKK